MKGWGCVIPLAYLTRDDQKQADFTSKICAAQELFSRCFAVWLFVQLNSNFIAGQFHSVLYLCSLCLLPGEISSENPNMQMEFLLPPHVVSLLYIELRG